MDNCKENGAIKDAEVKDQSKGCSKSSSEKKKHKGGKSFQLDWDYEGKTYLVTVEGEAGGDGRTIVNIEPYKGTLSNRKYEELDQLFFSSDDFIECVERLYAEHSASYVEWLHDEEIDRKIEESYARKHGVEL